jgi:hypothetical protein
MLFVFAFYPLIVFFLFVVIIMMGLWIARVTRCDKRMTFGRAFIITCVAFVWFGIVFIELGLLSMCWK